MPNNEFVETPDDLIAKVKASRVTANYPIYMERFSTHRSTLLAILYGARRKAFESEEKRRECESKIWNELRLTAFVHKAFDYISSKGAGITKRNKDYLEIQNMAKKTRALVESSVMYHDVLTIQYCRAIEKLKSPRLEKTGIVERGLVAINELTISLRALEMAAAEAKEPPLGRGRRAHTGVVRDDVVERLAEHYRGFTGNVPRSGVTSAFCKFTSAFLVAVGRELSEDGVAKAVANCRTWSLNLRRSINENGKLVMIYEPSPFEK
jgi:hypothetical protein